MTTVNTCIPHLGPWPLAEGSPELSTPTRVASVFCYTEQCVCAGVWTRLELARHGGTVERGVEQPPQGPAISRHDGAGAARTACGSGRPRSHDAVRVQRYWGVAGGRRAPSTGGLRAGRAACCPPGEASAQGARFQRWKGLWWSWALGPSLWEAGVVPRQGVLCEDDQGGGEPCAWPGMSHTSCGGALGQRRSAQRLRRAVVPSGPHRAQRSALLPGKPLPLGWRPQLLRGPLSSWPWPLRSQQGRGRAWWARPSAPCPCALLAPGSPSRGPAPAPWAAPAGSCRGLLPITHSPFPALGYGARPLWRGCGP